ncbi:MAG: hypothetical protein A3G59_01070 [Candidatus Taylorbacteria bacterium RIFCSPLOWO2_12_FULL_47_20]|uniref:Zinc finger DksA/TraR C4-type domain-containing protein n=2 Tax=Candidatus Tayloriibacteriota TaxID=1817919 RepID=A0A1G2PAT2_9BACT|nr:MAG: hypothetical protein A3H68_00370 [Candidatus Taylorbacteria bacterium RIFCSPLOWO2_02_FULL_46_40]OHA44742.1 MAG: hypothetical protein A3G59_01070 [Candidatus Taylorbacteria bacterium RIFCSPLOWO2_12_FULL_47_20]
MAQNIELKQKLEEELETLKKELATVGRINPENPKDWEPTAGVEAEHEHEPDPNDKADELEEYETNTAILKELEIRFNEVKDALKRIEEGNYGVCSICGKAIESARLEANPAATTCVEHTARAK